MLKNPCALIFWAAAISGPLRAAPPVIQSVATTMQALVDAREISGSVTLVADSENIIHLAATGLADVETQTAMRPDTVFWIASMTKPITATAVMMMQEEGRLSVDDPVARYLPEFRQLKDAAGQPASITIRQCLTHSSGLCDLSLDETKTTATLAGLSPLIASKPLKFPPGSQWQYCQTGINTVARIVEVVSGKSYPDFLQDRLFTPLGMVDTSFYPPAAQVARLATPYKRNASGQLEKTGLFFLNGQPPTSRDRYPMANGGLFSTAADYAKFAQMILRGGLATGTRYLQPASIRQMTSPQTGDLLTGFTPGNAWGLGWCIVCQPQGASAALSPGSFGHGGLFGTQAWIDPVKNRIHLLLIQRSDLPNSDASEIRRLFQNATHTPR